MLSKLGDYGNKWNEMKYLIGAEAQNEVTFDVPGIHAIESLVHHAFGIRMG